jgi:DNA-binding protein HU-beta
MTNLKTFTRRDSATALLRKMGIDKANYNEFITVKGDSFVVDVAAAEKSTIKGAEQAAVAAVSAGEAKQKPAKKQAAKAEPKKQAAKAPAKKVEAKQPAKKADKKLANPVDHKLCARPDQCWPHQC